jgi:hypothetical protein
MDSQSNLSPQPGDLAYHFRRAIIGHYYELQPHGVFRVQGINFPDSQTKNREDVFLTGYTLDLDTGEKTKATIAINFKYLDRDFLQLSPEVLERVAALEPLSPENTPKKYPVYKQDQNLQRNIVRGMSPQGA